MEEKFFVGETEVSTFARISLESAWGNTSPLANSKSIH
jgi:hypothetical protein